MDKGFTTEITINTIVIIQNLPTSELQTGTRLYEDLELKLLETGIRRELHYPKNSGEFLSILEKIHVLAQSGKYLPWMHWDIHGYDGGLLFGEHEDQVSWGTITPILCKINQALGFNLFLCLAVCHGSTSLQEIVKTSNMAPFSACFSSFEEEKVDVIAKGFSQFYDTLFLQRKGIKDAAEDFKKISPGTGFRLLRCEGIFYYSAIIALKQMLIPGAAEKGWAKLPRRGLYSGNAKKLRKKRNEYIKYYQTDDFRKTGFEKMRTDFFGGNQKLMQMLPNYEDVMERVRNSN